MKAVGDNITKYVYGVGLIGEETAGSFKTYHFDYRGSTVAITDSTGAVTDTFTYDSYGNVTSRTDTSDVIFLYNGKYGVVSDNNGLLYMRARYYSPELRRFVNADVLMGDINNSATLNRYAYANGNPISNVDPFGMSAERGDNNLYYGNIWNGLPELDMLYADENIFELFDKSSFNLIKSEESLINSWKTLANIVSNDTMADVLIDMINHFADGTGTDYSNDTLTNVVKNHITTQNYMNDITETLKKLLNKHNGNYEEILGTDEFSNELNKNKIFLSQYSYGGSLFDKYTWNGLTMAIHSWTESIVDISSFNVLGNKYFGTLQFTFKDNFGLDYYDIKEFGAITGFQSWYILQHNEKYEGKYKPFKTVVTLNYEFSGTII